MRMVPVRSGDPCSRTLSPGIVVAGVVDARRAMTEI
jgi:hypothetical protein